MTRRLLPLLLVFAFTGAQPGQVPSKARIDSLLHAASNALDHYQTLPPSIRCNHANEKTLRDSCNGVLEMLGRDVQDAKKNIARYRALAAPQSVDLFDIYEIFQKIMEGISDLGYVGDLYGETNRALFAETYNRFMKITLWFGGEVRNTLQCSADKKSRLPTYLALPLDP
jgi:hypothetical protein